MCRLPGTFYAPPRIIARPAHRFIVLLSHLALYGEIAVLLMDELLQLADQATAPQWFAALQALSLKIGYSRLLFGLKPSANADNQDALINSDYPANWRKRYDDNGYAGLDPVVKHCLSSNRPLLWHRRDYQTPAHAHFFEEAAFHGLDQGLALPLHGVDGQAGMFCLQPADTGQHAEQHILHTLPMVTLLRDFALEGAVRLRAEPPAVAVRLTNREREVLQWSAAGKTTWEIAVIHSCTTAAIDFHFKNIRRKFQVTSRQAAVVKAMQQRLINP